MPRFVEHAEDRLRERNITKEQIGQALARPVGRPQPGDGGNMVIWGYASGGPKPMLKVVVAAEDQNLVISAWWKDGR